MELSIDPKFIKKIIIDNNHVTTIINCNKDTQIDIKVLNVKSFISYLKEAMDKKLV